MPAIIVQMEHRDNEGQLANSLAKEARALNDWATKEYPGVQVPTSKTIENGVRDRYRELTNPIK